LDDKSPDSGRKAPLGSASLGTAVACCLGALAGIFAFAIAAGVTGSLPAAFGIAILAGGLVAWTFRTRPFLPLDPSACSRGLKIVAVIATIVALVQTTRLAVFMVDSSKTGYSLIAGAFFTQLKKVAS